MTTAASCSRILCPLVVAQLLCVSMSWANPQVKIQQVASQLAPLWQTYQPLCVMGLQVDIQLRVAPRIQLLNEFLTPPPFIEHLSQRPSVIPDEYWQHALWNKQAELEANALEAQQRETFREYYFKLQTHQANPVRAQLVHRMQQAATQLNAALREGLWKTCATLGLENMALEQIEAVAEHRWNMQKDRVQWQLEQTIAAFYFYTYRHVNNQELEEMTLLHEAVQPWAEDMAEGIREYFAQLRLVMLSHALAKPVNAFSRRRISPSVASPFPANPRSTP